ncbi:GspH/FimT family pseudopilin [Nevskia sp.]|uniref:GspH/FimT family pseudopilin n=1 Tax=Nevskia sp. TaxID=1929292 RepID=UPI0025D91EFA|nr:GspH/FimT family pseudopilin [Nevskia sp.]
MPSPSPVTSGSRRPRGFTLIEMLTAVAVLAVTTTVGIPALNGFVTGNRAAAQVNSLIGALNYARSEAVSSARQVSLCPYTEDADATDAAARYSCMNSTTWQQGWVVFRAVVDEAGNPTGAREILRVFGPLSSGDALSGNVSTITYLPTGFLADDAASPRFSLIPQSCSADQRREVSLSLQGQAHVATANC